MRYRCADPACRAENDDPTIDVRATFSLNRDGDDISGAMVQDTLEAVMEDMHRPADKRIDPDAFIRCSVCEGPAEAVE